MACIPSGGIDDAIGYLLRRSYKMAVPAMERLFVGEELSFTQWVALMHLKSGEIDTASGLARCLDNDSGATTRMVDQFEARRLVTRRRSATDRRITRITLSGEGAAAADRLRPKVEAFWADILVDFTPGEVEDLRALLRRLADSLDTANGNRA